MTSSGMLSKGSCGLVSIRAIRYHGAIDETYFVARYPKLLEVDQLSALAVH